MDIHNSMVEKKGKKMGGEEGMITYSFLIGKQIKHSPTMKYTT